MKGDLTMKEIDCREKHVSIVDAIEHARKNLGLIREEEHPRLGIKVRGPLANKDRIIGFTDATGLKGWRVDWDPTKGCHLNEEDYSDKGTFRKVCHRIPMNSEQWTTLWWKKFTSAGLAAYRKKPVLVRNRVYIKQE
jgi:hypothetical protein